MEKTKTKKKKSKRLRRRIGLIAVGGMSLVLTVCLSVGATLAWFAGSTWASNDMYMGGPVYVEMAGRGHAGATAGGGDNAEWVGGEGKLDIIASKRTTGTVSESDSEGAVDMSNILLPGQKLLIYSQARVFSTAYYTNEQDNAYNNQSSGANTTNTSGNAVKYTDGSGRVKTTTSSVLRAKFSIDIEFDPTSGFNNFTDAAYANGYPTQSANYAGQGATGETWDKAHNGTAFTTSNNGTAITYAGRRDNVTDTKFVKGTEDGALAAIKAGTKTSIYKWKFVSQKEYLKAGTAEAAGTEFVRMGAPFDGTVNSAGGASNTKWNDGGTGFETNDAAGATGNGFYGVYICDKSSGTKLESDAFYKARCSAYIQSYKEHYVDEYNRELALQIGTQITALEDALNESFTDLVNQSSDNINKGLVTGFKADEDGSVDHNTAISPVGASWLYVDPQIGNDINASDSSSSVGGWWYLVESDTASVVDGENEVKTVVDSFSTTTTGGTGKTETDTNGLIKYTWDDDDVNLKNTPTEGSGFVRDATGYSKTDDKIKNAKLFEIKPDNANGVTEVIGNNGTTKVVSISFPFVNGNFELPGRELTNIFANAKISFKIQFQALQAFFPFTPSIDGLAAGSALAGTAKALNINNAIPIFNEAFDYLSYLNTFTSR